MKIHYLFYLLILLLVVPPISATSESFTNVAMNGAATNYTYQVGNDQLEAIVNVPTTIEDVAYPVEFFYIFLAAGIGILLYGIWFATRPDYIPSMGIIACGFLALGIFFALAEMAPYVATTSVIQQIVPTVAASGATPLNATNTIYLTTVNNYVFSSWVGYMMWGGGVAGLVEAILGSLAYIGWFHRKGLKNAQKGKYIETDVEDDEPAKMFNQ